MYLDPGLEDNIKVTVIATGFSACKEEAKPEALSPKKSEIISSNEFDTIIGSGINLEFLPRRGKRDDFRYENDEDLDVPTVMRDRRFFNIPEGNLAFQSRRETPAETTARAQYS
jgi:hypothetical protein